MWATLLRVENPGCAWCAGTASDAQVSVLSHLATSEGTVWEEAEVSGPRWRARLADAAGAPSVRRVSILESTDARARVRLELASCPLQQAVAASGAMPRFPFDATRGDEWLLIAERAEARRFVEELRTRGVLVEVLSTRAYRPHESLTGRQRELMQAAIAQGYYEVPRRVTLTQLAERLHLAKSSLSEALARGERHVLEDLRVARK